MALEYVAPSRGEMTVGSLLGASLAALTPAKKDRPPLCHLAMGASLGAVAPVVISAVHTVANEGLTFLAQLINYFTSFASNQLSNLHSWAQTNPLLAGGVGLVGLAAVVALSWTSAPKEKAPANETPPATANTTTTASA